MAMAQLSVWGNTFCGYDVLSFVNLIRRLVHPTAPVLLTRYGPLKNHVCIALEPMELIPPCSYVGIHSLRIS
jgi:hypothetical protein